MKKTKRADYEMAMDMEINRFYFIRMTLTIK